MTDLPSSVVFGGIDTHRDTIVVAVVDPLGRQLGVQSFATVAEGYRACLSWLGGFGVVDRVGVEGSSSYGAGISSVLHAAAIAVIEISGPSRAVRRRRGKDDPTDALAAARAVAGGVERGVAKTRGGSVESVGAILSARETTLGSRRRAWNALVSMRQTAPEPVRASLVAVKDKALLEQLVRSRPDRTRRDDPAVATRIALRSLARQIAILDDEIADLTGVLEALVADAGPTLVAMVGVGPVGAAKLLVCAGENASRIHSAEAFAVITGTAPIAASSGQHQRFRLSRGGDRQGNAAIHRIVLCRLRHDDATKAYMASHLLQNKTKREIIRLLKRYLANAVYHALIADEIHRNKPNTADVETAPCDR